MKKYIDKNYIVKFILTLFVVGMLFGSLFYVVTKPDLNVYFDNFKSLIVTSNNNTYIMDIATLSLIFLSSITGVGAFLIMFFVFYEGLSIGYTFTAFSMAFGLKGALFYLLFFIIVKLIFITLLMYLSCVSLKFSINLLRLLIKKKRDEIGKYISRHTARFIIVFTASIVNSTLIYFFSNKIISLFISLIK